MNEKQLRTFSDFVEHHERIWQGTTYPGRPTVEEMTTQPIVAFWSDSTISPDAYIATTHTTFEPIQAYFDRLVRRIAIGFPNRRLKALFGNKQRIRIMGAKIAVKRDSEF